MFTEHNKYEEDHDSLERVQDSVDVSEDDTFFGKIKESEEPGDSQYKSQREDAKNPFKIISFILALVAAPWSESNR